MAVKLNQTKYGANRSAANKGGRGGRGNVGENIEYRKAVGNYTPKKTGSMNIPFGWWWWWWRYGSFSTRRV